MPSAIAKNLAITALFASLATLTACSQSPPKTASSTNFFVPSTMIVQSTNPNPAQPGINPYQLLPTSDSFDFFVPRGEKVAFGSTTIGDYTAYSTYTYDQQLISTIGGPSYRYRWIVQQGISAPPPTP